MLDCTFTYFNRSAHTDRIAREIRKRERERDNGEKVGRITGGCEAIGNQVVLPKDHIDLAGLSQWFSYINKGLLVLSFVLKWF